MHNLNNMISYREICYNVVMYSVWLCLSYLLSSMVLLLFANNQCLVIIACCNGKTSDILHFISCEPFDMMFGEHRNVHILLFNESSSVYFIYLKTGCFANLMNCFCYCRR